MKFDMKEKKSIYIFSCKKSKYDSDDKDTDALLCLRNLLHGTNSKLDERSGKYPNIDGYFELTDEGGSISEKLAFQIKSYPKSERGLSKYRIPSYILGYAERMKGEVVIFIAADYEEKKIYWKYIDSDYIQMCANNGLQESYTYVFNNSEIACRENINLTIEIWRKIYHKKMSSIIDRKTEVSRKIKNLLRSFNNVKNIFFGLPNSYIDRKEVLDLYKWISGPLCGENNIALLVGNAGTGKSVVLKQLINKLSENNISYMAIKADMHNITKRQNANELECLCEDFGYISSYNDKSVLIIDQIDALSQNLSNDRMELNSYLALINNFATSNHIKDIRVVISCRKFDLKYDPSLSNLINNKIIMLQPLTCNDVKGILEKLQRNLSAKLSPSTIELLRTPQYLDMYCRLYNINGLTKNYNSFIDLYDELWRDIKNENKKINIEPVLFDIAKKMRDAQTLNINWTVTDNNEEETKILASNGIICYNENKIHFFHQSFYDYVLARKYIVSNQSFVKDIVREHQGLFLRTTVKLMLDYYREYDNIKYNSEVKALLASEKVRTHIKLLVLNLLCTYTEITPLEKKLLLSLRKNDSDLYYYFVKQVNSLEWFDEIKRDIQNDVEDLMINSHNCSDIWQFLFHYVAIKPNEVYLMVGTIRDSVTKNETAKRVLWFTKDYSLAEVQKWYHFFYSKSKNYDHVYIENAIASNITFACDETGEILKQLLLEQGNPRQQYEKHYFIFDICEQLYNKDALTFYHTLKDVIICVIQKSSVAIDKNSLRIDNIFYGILHDANNNQVIKWLIKILQNNINSNADSVHQEVKFYLSYRSVTTYIIAFQVMEIEPREFIKEISQIYYNSKLIDLLLSHQATSYYLRLLLGKTFKVLNENEKESFRDFVLNFKSETDYLTNGKEKNDNQQPYPYLHCRQRELIYTIPEEELTGEIKKIRGELDRKYPFSCTNVEPIYDVSMASICGGITSHDKYKLFSKKTWLNSFLQLQENSRSSKGQLRHLDLRIHSKEFEQCVSEEPDKFFPFIKQISQNTKINVCYRLSGILGLLKGHCNPVDVFPLFKQILDDKTSYSNQIFNIIGLLVKNESWFIDDIIIFLKKVITSTFKESKYSTDIENHEIDGTSDLLMSGVNSEQGNAIEALIKICGIKKRQATIYKYLTELYPSLCPELQLVVIYNIYYKEYYNDFLFPSLLTIYTSEPISEFLLIRPEIINKYLHDEPKIILPYLRSILHHKRAQRLLSNILFWGCGYEKSKEESKVLLDTLLLDNNLSAISVLIQMSMENIFDATYHSLSKLLLIKYRNDERDEILTTYMRHCSSLPVDEFPLFNTWLFLSIKRFKRDNMYGVLDYIKKSSNTYPSECYKSIKAIISSTNVSTGYYDKNILEVLLSIYKCLKEEDDVTSMEEIMDTFDELMLHGNVYEINDAMTMTEFNTY